LNAKRAPGTTQGPEVSIPSFTPAVNSVNYDCARHESLAPLQSVMLPAAKLPSSVDTSRKHYNMGRERFEMNLKRGNKMIHEQGVEAWLEGVVASEDQSLTYLTN
jgi:hypothetical protein